MIAIRFGSRFFFCTLVLLGTVSVGRAAPTIARTWNEQNLDAIRIDFPNPPVHARNLFHVSVAMWDAWAAYDPVAKGYLHNETATAGDIAAARHEAISYAAYRVLRARYALSVNAATSLAALDAQMAALPYPIDKEGTTGPDPDAVGNRVAATVLAFSLNDGSNESSNYADPTYAPVNSPMILSQPYDPLALPNINRWQPLAFTHRVSQNGIPIPENIQSFVGSHWGEARPFALHRAPDEIVYFDPGPPPELGGVGDAAFKQGNVDVIAFSSLLDPDSGTTIDISPGAIGNNTLGTNDGSGYVENPATSAPYPANLVKHADFGRVVAEFWADGPHSETPPGHWNTLANQVVEAKIADPLDGLYFMGSGSPLDPLEWDVKMYFILNAAVHEAAVAVWGCKRAYDYVRPISSIRYMGSQGQSSDPGGPSPNPNGLPLVDNLIAVITEDSILPGQPHADFLPGDVGKIAIYAWGGEPGDPETEYTGAKWILATEWLPYQRDTFVTPAFAGYVSGHSAFSRAAAEVLTLMTGSPFFPGGIGSHTVPAGALDFELGPSADVELQWATYYDAADQAGISRLYGGIHVPADDGPGRIVGSSCGLAAWNLALKYFDGSVTEVIHPCTLARTAGGDVVLQWEQFRGMFYKVQISAGLGNDSYVDLTTYTRAVEDSGEITVPAGSLAYPASFFRVLRSPTGTP